MRTAFQGAVAQTLPVYDLILLLKVARDGACLTSSSRVFQSLGPRKDIALCPLLDFRKGIERSVSVFLSSLTFRVDLFSNKLERYSGTRPFRGHRLSIFIFFNGIWPLRSEPPPPSPLTAFYQTGLRSA